MKSLIINFLNFLDKYIQDKNLRILRKYFKSEINVYIDIGAHKGEMIEIIKKNFNVKKTLAFEPNIECFRYLNRLKDKKTKIFNLAVSDKLGVDFLKIGHISAMSTLNEINENAIYTYIKKIIINIFFFKRNIYKKKILIKKIKLKNILDKYKLKTLDLIKIDTEGHEYRVLIGMDEYIDKTKIILLECHYDQSLIKNYDFEKIDSFLNKKKFKLVSKNQMIFRKGYELIYINKKYY
tara:strand:- start:4435 stop:5145 length:711 start_codon:yes stop_codon:yes gene_type:complete